MIGGTWPSVRGVTRATMALKLSVFWPKPLALTPDLGSALVSAPSMTCTMDHHKLWQGWVNHYLRFTGL